MIEDEGWNEHTQDAQPLLLPVYFTEWMKPYVLQFLSADEELATCDNNLVAKVER